jgi:prepilin-type N-terminal cleavage/methylation domain-containing protein
MKKFRKGFTLIEMLIVITIIALLASIVLVGMGGARAKTRDSRRVADLHNVMNGLELYYSKNYAYPNVSDWDALSLELTTADIGVSRVPQDPLNSPNGATYLYGLSADLQDYELGATLEGDEDPALDDDIDTSLYLSSCADPIYCIRP